jgi:HEPN domain-containing protein
MSEIKQTGDIAATAERWVHWADQDYIAARQLLLNRFLVQGSGLSNTAVEKYLKAVLIMTGTPFPRGRNGHDVGQLYAKLHDVGIKPNVNTDYLRLTGKAYALRYPDDLEAGFNIVLCQTKMLVELDATVHAIRKGFHFEQVSATGQQRTLQVMLTIKAPEIVDRNCYFGTAKRAELFAQPSACYELRVLGDGEMLQASYDVQEVKDDNRFDEVALKPGPGNPPNLS